MLVAGFVGHCYYYNPMKRHYPFYDRVMDRLFRVFHAVEQIFQNHIRRYQSIWEPHSMLIPTKPWLLLSRVVVECSNFFFTFEYTSFTCFVLPVVVTCCAVKM